MNKTDIHQKCISHLSERVQSLEAAARKTASVATDEEHKARSKYETFSLENSYLARGQAKRVEEMQSVLASLRAMQVVSLPAEAEVRMGALVEVTEPTGEGETFWVVPAGGGEEVKIDGRVIQLLTPQSPLARVLLKKRAGESVSFAGRTLCIQSVS